MKKTFTLSFIAAVVASGATLNAQDWEKLDQKLVDNYKGHAFAADFSGNNHYDLYNTGAYSSEWCKPLNYRLDGGWESISAMIYNNGDGTVTLDWNSPVNFEDPGFNPDSYIEGTPNNTYMRWPNHNIVPSGMCDAIALDYNNDGLVDFLVSAHEQSDGWWFFWGGGMKNDAGEEAGGRETSSDRRREYTTLYKNLGDGRFQVVENSGLLELSSLDGNVARALSFGDYDRDGYIDIVMSGTYHQAEYEKNVNELHKVNRFVKLFRNRGEVADGEPQFEEMLIANTIGGVYTQQVNDESGDIAIPKKLLEGEFAPISGNVQFADINNDGWLDIISAGYGEIWDGVYQGGPLVRVYINKEGKAFQDVTTQESSELLVGVNDGAIVINDFDKDGYLDLMNAGYSWALGGWYNTMYLNQQTENVYGEYLDQEETGAPATEKARMFATDFDNDGNLDLYCASNLGRAAIFYGTGNATFEEDNTDMTGNGWKNDGDHFGTILDFDGDGIADIYVPSERTPGDDGAMVPNPNPAVIQINKMVSDAPVAPVAPTAVGYEVSNDTISISWDYDTDAAIESNLAYNIYVKYSDGSIHTLVPADITTGFVRVVEGRQVALRPTVTEYEIASSKPVAEVGVQAISLNNFTQSAFAKGTTSGIDNVIADNDSDVAPVYYNMQGIRVSNPASGHVLIKVQGEKATKIVF